ncbi:hypothetical protein [Spirosoma pomorum]
MVDPQKTARSIGRAVFVVFGRMFGLIWPFGGSSGRAWVVAGTDRQPTGYVRPLPAEFYFDSY